MLTPGANANVAATLSRSEHLSLRIHLERIPVFVGGTRD